MSKSSMQVDASVGLIGCGCYLAFFAVAWLLSAWAFQYSVMVWFGKDLPTWVDWLCGLLLMESMLVIWVVSLIADFVAESTPIFP